MESLSALKEARADATCLPCGRSSSLSQSPAPSAAEPGASGRSTLPATNLEPVALNGTSSPYGSPSLAPASLGKPASHPLSREVARILSRPFLDAPFLPEALACLSSFYLPGHHTDPEGSKASLGATSRAGLGTPPLLVPLIYREKLRIHQEALAAFAPIRSQIADLSCQVQLLSRTCSQAASQLRRSRSHLAPLLHGVEALRGQQRTLHSRQRLCHLLLDSLQLPEPLLEALTGRKGTFGAYLAEGAAETAGPPSEAGDNGAGLQLTGPEPRPEEAAKEDLRLDGRFFEALQELEKIRKRALKLQAKMSQASMAHREFSKEQELARTNPEPLDGPLQFFSRAAPRLADDVLQHTADLREAAYERLYLWIQRVFRSAVGAGVSSEARPGGRRSETSGPRGQSGKGYRDAPDTHSKGIETLAIRHVEAFAAALAATGLIDKCEREGTRTCGEQRLRAVLGVEEDSPLLLRGFQVLEERPAYLQDSVQEFSRVRSQLITDAFWGTPLDSEGDRVLPRGTGPVLSVLTTARNLSAYWRKAGVLGGNKAVGGKPKADVEGRTGADAAPHVLPLGASFDTVCRAEPVQFLRATLQYVAHAVAAERAVTRGLVVLLPSEDAQSPSRGAPAGNEAVGGKSAKQTEETDRPGGAERSQRESLAGVDTHQDLQAGASGTQDATGEESRRALEKTQQGGFETGKSAARAGGYPSESSEGPGFALSGEQAGTHGDEQVGVRSVSEMRAGAALRGTRLLQEHTAGMHRPLRAAIEQAFSMIRASTASSGAAGNRLLQQHVLGVLLMVRLLDAYSALLRSLLVFGATVAGSSPSASAPRAERDGGSGVSERKHAETHEQSRGPSVSDPTYPSPALRGRTGNPIRTDDELVNAVVTPELVRCCEEFADKGEELFLSLWERQVVRAASSSPVARLSSMLLSGRLSPEAAGAEKESAGTGGDSELISSAEGGVFLELTGRLREALEILHAPVISAEEEDELWLLASGIAAAASRPASAEKKGEGSVPSWATAQAVLDVVINRDALIWGTEVKLRGCRLEGVRRSRVTGLSAFEELSGDGSDSGPASEELHAWVEASVAPLLNFCRQEARRFSDAGETAVCLINAYASVQEPLRRFRVCGSYLRVLAELLDQQMATLVQVESGRTLASLGLAERLDAVRRAVDRERRGGVAGNGAKPLSVEGNKAPLQVGREQCESGPDDDVLLHKEELVKFFREFYVALYGASALNLDYVDRLMHRHLRSNARKAVLHAVLQAYTEIYVHTSDLRAATHTPEDVALLLDV
ncbi:conserved hypothetical protein [Neospora caninum Liverpool]|uniref:Conserved oligomeric Golgi complex subunit 6 n=1 Tax=Neospora caninum (strain Liverpool) TaxID=572307 RepID=F0VMD2_NEOCL|nr:conserved hypothetical protein [Neospora caninum Liverpool]CBZ54410.1 conserved hypothetical protein [Neospora caninum Liverpool]CEL69119.1 TPA: hypothetical protein BN1204_048390 [Neospora caninum Liverpool]|eukprot:XP_003884440.1 conserved hypothetical protein [Neospora caninum Liverpool]